jgi:hypothetical protein
MNKVQCNMDQCNKVGLKNIVTCWFVFSCSMFLLSAQQTSNGV